MKEVIFMTGNQHKLKEVQDILGEQFNLESAKSFGFSEDVVEDAESFDGNAKLKVDAFLAYIGSDKVVMAEDSGLCVDFLDGAPGIYTARYAGEDGDNNKNMELLLKNLHDVKNRDAYFITSICLYYEGQYHYFDGRIYGTIGYSKLGDQGFGYDPIFIPRDEDLTLAELGSQFKKENSHRSIAFKKLLQHLAK